MEIIGKYIELVIVVMGIVLLLAAIFDWSFFTKPQTVRRFGLSHILHSLFGDKGLRVSVGISGIAFIIIGIVVFFTRR